MQCSRLKQSHKYNTELPINTQPMRDIGRMETVSSVRRLVMELGHNNTLTE